MNIVVRQPTLVISPGVVLTGENLVRQHWWIGGSDSIDWRSHLPRDVKNAPVWRGSSKPGTTWVDRPVVLDDAIDLANYFDLPKNSMRELFYSELFHELPPRFFALWRRHIEQTESLPRLEFAVNRSMSNWRDPEFVI